MAAKDPPKMTDAARVAARYLDRWERHVSLTATGASGDGIKVDAREAADPKATAEHE